MKIPNSMDHEVAAALSMTYGTSLYALKQRANLLRLVPNEIEKTLFIKNECIWLFLNFQED